MQRRTKIVATLGPATDKEGILESLIIAGVNVVRMNFSHGAPEDHKKRALLVRELAVKHNRQVAVLGDLQGPKIRISRFVEGSIILRVGDKFILDADMGKDEGTQHAVGIDYKGLPKDCSVGNLLLLDDGRMVLLIEAIDGNKFIAVRKLRACYLIIRVLNLQGGGLSAPALTKKDLRDIHLAAEMDVDYLAVSFPRTA